MDVSSTQITLFRMCQAQVFSIEDVHNLAFVLLILFARVALVLPGDQNKVLNAS